MDLGTGPRTGALAKVPRFLEFFVSHRSRVKLPIGRELAVTSLSLQHSGLVSHVVWLFSAGRRDHRHSALDSYSSSLWHLF